MFSLIITIIAIALVAALALATIYYGGAAFNKGSEAATATRVLTQAQQLSGAMDLYKADFGEWPATLQELVTKGYLQTIPSVAQVDGRLATAAFANTAGWEMPVSGVPVIVLKDDAVSQAVCKEVNSRTLGHNGILKQAYNGYATQCYGASAGELAVVVSRAEVLSAGLPAGEVATVAPPAVSEVSSPAWLLAPGAPSSSESPPPAPVPPAGPQRVVLNLGANQNTSWLSNVYLEDTFGTKVDISDRGGILVARIFDIEGRCAVDTYDEGQGIYITNGTPQSVNNCFVVSGAPGLYTMEVLTGSYETFYVPIEVR